MVSKKEKTSKDKRIKDSVEIVKRIKGDRSTRQMAIDSGVSASCLSGVLNGNHLISPDVANKITAPEAKPQGGETTEDLMIAAGYQTYSLSNEGEAFSEKNSEKIKNEEKLFNGILISELVRSKIDFEIEQSLYNKEFDFAIKVGEKKWYFDFWINANENNQSSLYRSIYLKIGRLTMMKPDKQRKISIVTNSEAVFSYIKQHFNWDVSYKGDLSFIYINKDNKALEEYMSYYDSASKKESFKIK